MGEAVSGTKAIAKRDEESLGFLQFLQGTGALDASAALRVEALLAASSLPIEQVLSELGLLQERDLAAHAAQYLNTQCLGADQLSNLQTNVRGQDFHYFASQNIVLLSRTDSQFEVATSLPFSSPCIAAFAFQHRLAARIFVADQPIIAAHLQTLTSAEEAPLGDARGVDETLRDSDVERLLEAAQDAPIVRELAGIIADAMEKRATDIHIEPYADKVQVRVRVDGDLRTVKTLQKTMQSGLVSRVKVLAQLNIAESRLPQDGSLRTIVRGQPVDLRVSTIPVVHGEGVVLRVLNNSQVPLQLASLGFDQLTIQRLERAASQPHGMVVVTGPTGSGKSTTLYALLATLAQECRKLISIEDPVERQVHGVNQIQVNPSIGLTFSHTLRSVLRQDPDVILIGEMRDRETAEIAVRASMTGHMVLSTLHTNSAIGAVSRLRDMGVENFMLASGLSGLLAQRLVPVACPACNSSDATRIEQERRERNKKEKHECPTCNGTGYSGRTVAHEFLEVTPDLRRAIASGMDELQLLAIATANGFVPMSSTPKPEVSQSSRDRRAM